MRGFKMYLPSKKQFFFYAMTLHEFYEFFISALDRLKDIFSLYRTENFAIRY